MSSGHDTWVTIVMHQVATTVVSLAFWQDHVRTAIVVGSLVIFLEIVLKKERLSRSKSNVRVYTLIQAEAKTSTSNIVAG